MGRGLDAPQRIAATKVGIDGAAYGRCVTETTKQKRTTHQVAKAGVQSVAAEIERRGGHATPTKGNYLRASDAEHGHTVEIRVKTKTRGTWQTSIDDGRPMKGPQNQDQFWVLVDLGPNEAEFYIAPAWWMENDIYTNHQRYLDEHAGHRAQNDQSKHHAIPVKRLEQWKERWDILGIFPT